MVSDLSLSISGSESGAADKLDERTSSGKKSQAKVSKKVHKAEREKLKRDHLNELFLELGHALEPSRQNNGKASILGDATKLLRDLILQVETLRREHVTLLTESRYVDQEKNDLKDETSSLASEIEKLQAEIRERMQSSPAWSNGVDVVPSLPPAIAPPIQQSPVVGPMFVFPLHQDIPPYSEPSGERHVPPEPSSQVRRPQARYPTPADSWPAQILSQQPRAMTLSGDSSVTTSNGELVEGSKELKLMD